MSAAADKNPYSAPNSELLPPPPAKSQGRRAVSAFYRILIPLLWLLVTWTSWKHPGDEYGLFAVGALPGIWIVAFLKFSHLREVLPAILLVGGATMALAGWLMDRLRIWKLVWLSLLIAGTCLLVLWALSQFPTYNKAISRNGSLTAYIAASLNISSYVAASTLIVLTAVGRGLLYFQRR